jgi:acylphosphatase
MLKALTQACKQSHNIGCVPDSHMATNPGNPPETRRYIVRGRVQGVGFRWFVEREARALGLSGWVRNTYDGSVEVLAMGSQQQLSALRQKLRQGPRAARVDDVEESESHPVPDLKTFRIEGTW